MVQSKSKSRHDDSDGTPPPAKSKSKSKNREATPEDLDMEQDEGEGDEEEYEIEKIVTAKKSGKSFEYFVKWKGYDSEENTWVMEEDMAADELLADYKKANPDTFAPAKPRKSSSVAKKPPPPQESSSDSEDERDRERAKLRKSNAGTSGRVSTSGKQDTSRNKHKRDSSAMSEDENDRTTVQTSKKSRNDKGPLDFDGRLAKLDDETNLPVADLKFVSKMSKMESWEKYITIIETVESRGKDKIVYFRTRHEERGIAFSSELKAKCPGMLIDFYEAHLRWRESPNGEDGNTTES